MAVARAATMLKEARMMVEVLMDLAAENLSSLKNICFVRPVAGWKKSSLDRLKLFWGIHLVSSRDSSHPTPQPTGGIWLRR